MKKLMALVLALALSVSLVACGAKDTPAPQSGEATKDFRVYLLVSNFGDKSFNDSANVGLKKAEAELGIKYTGHEFGTDESKAMAYVQEAAEDGYDVIAFNNIGFGIATKWVTENAAKYPDTTFLVYDEYDYKAQAPNVQMILFNQSHSDFLAGALAAKMSKTGTIGFVGGMDQPVIADFLVGYIAGAQYVNPNIKMTISYTENWIDATKGKELGLASIAAGADFVHAVAGGSGNGALEAAQEKGVYGIGVDADQYELYKTDKPELAKSIVTSSLKDVGAALYDCVKQIKEGTFKAGGETWYGMEKAAAGIAKNENYLALVPKDVQEYITELETKIASGEVKVPTYFGMSDADYQKMKDSVKK